MGGIGAGAGGGGIGAVLFTRFRLVVVLVFIIYVCVRASCYSWVCCILFISFYGQNLIFSISAERTK